MIELHTGKKAGAVCPLGYSEDGDVKPETECDRLFAAGQFAEALPCYQEEQGEREKHLGQVGRVRCGMPLGMRFGHRTKWP
jgi:hypothetical protein